jgi:hypothetical protein
MKYDWSAVVHPYPSRSLEKAICLPSEDHVGAMS